MTVVAVNYGEGFVSARPSMTGGRAAFKAGGPSNFAAYPERAAHACLLFSAQQNRFLPRRCAAPTVALTATPPPVFLNLFSMVRTDFEEVNMAHVIAINTASDRVMATLVAGLEIEFGRGAAQGLARHFLDAEEVDFHWDARVSERWLSAYKNIDDDDLELDRIAICGFLDGRWFAATLMVDGDDNPHGMLGCRTFDSERAAHRAYTDAR